MESTQRHVCRRAYRATGVTAHRLVPRRRPTRWSFATPRSAVRKLPRLVAIPGTDARWCDRAASRREGVRAPDRWTSRVPGACTSFAPTSNAHAPRARLWALPTRQAVMTSSGSPSGACMAARTSCGVPRVTAKVRTTTRYERQPHRRWARVLRPAPRTSATWRQRRGLVPRSRRCPERQSGHPPGSRLRA